ncbi:hypothetical protein [Mycolicibacterium celeriflavum]|uniref:hypothetical protein n=1 Tax=Mycolicibacterium celeriflavum TaxID=1249101 RepID=UPI003CEC29FA
MHNSRSAEPAERAVVHHMTTRHGERLSLIVDDDGARHLLVADSCGFDAPGWEVVLDPDDAERLAEMLTLRRGVDEPNGDRGR